jgi:ribosome-associated protein
MTDTDTLGKKDTQKLQRAIVDALEDVKGQDIQVFDTEHLSALFERVIIASGTSNRQTKALAASVRDKVREAGFPKPRIEGEENGEWIIVDCGAAVAHVMQPTIRQYYNLEEIWGDKPVRLKFGAPKPLVKAEAPATKKAAAKKSTTGKKAAAGKDGETSSRAPLNAATKVPAKRAAAKTPRPLAPPAPDLGQSEGKSAKPSVKRTPPATKTAVKTVVVKAPVRKTPAKKAASAVKTAPAKAPPAKRAPAKKAASSKA